MTKTADAAVALAAVAGGLFLGLFIVSLLNEVAGVRRTKRLVAVSVLVATAASAGALWWLLGYKAVASEAPRDPKRIAPMVESTPTLTRSMRSTSAGGSSLARYGSFSATPGPASSTDLSHAERGVVRWL